MMSVLMNINYFQRSLFGSYLMLVIELGDFVKWQGSLPYNHEEWIKIRCCLEEFFCSAHDMADKFGHLFYQLERKQELDTVEAAKRALEEHRFLRLKIVQAPVSALEAEADRLIAWLRYGVAAANSVTGGSTSSSQSHPVPTTTCTAVNTTNSVTSTVAIGTSGAAAGGGGGGGASFLATSWVSMNPDFQQACLVVFFSLYVHAQLSRSVSLLCVIVNSRQLYVSNSNSSISWSDPRLPGLILSKFMQSYPLHNCCLVKCYQTLAPQVRQTVVKLYEYRAHLQQKWEAGRSRFEQVHQLRIFEDDVNRMATWLGQQRHLFLTEYLDIGQTASHIWAWFKQLERVYTERKSHLNSNLAMLMFKEDVGHVLSWLSEHGEPFLQRQTSVGKSSLRAEQLYNTHMQFEQASDLLTEHRQFVDSCYVAFDQIARLNVVAGMLADVGHFASQQILKQVAAKTLLNAEKLLSVADELAAHADDPEDLLQRASELQRRIAAFTRAIETRRETVDLGCGFYSHTKKVLSWLNGFRDGHNPGEHLPASIEGMEDEITNFHRDRSEMEEEADRVATEGEALISRLKDPDEVAHIRSVLLQVSNERATVSNLLTERQVRLDLCLQLRLFEADVNSALDRLRQTVPSLATLMANRNDTIPAPPSSTSNLYAWFSDPRQAPDLSSLEEVSSICLSVLPIAEEVLHKGGELARAFESLGAALGPAIPGVGDSIESAVERVHRLSNELTETVTVVDDLNERISEELDWRRLQLQSKQVLNWINQCEDILRETAIIPANLAEAQALQTEHEKFQPVLNDAHPQAVQCTARATMLLQQTANTTTGGLSSSTAGTEHPRRKDYRAIAEAVADHWQKLVYAAEDRHKLLITAANWYKTSEQVSSVLWSLEKEYNREEDWCQNVKAGVDVSAYLNQLSVKHAEQKEAFLKACMLARRTSDVFSRYLHRQSPTTTGRTEVEEKIRKAMSELMAKEQAVLEAWAVRRRRIDDCTYFVNIKRQVEELLTRVQNQSHTPSSPSKGPVTLTGSTQLGSSLIQEVRRACESLESMITASMPLSPGHTSQLQALLRHLQASLPQPTADTGAKTSANTVGLDVGTPYPSQTTAINQRKPSGLSMVSSRLDIPASRTKRPDVDTDRTSVSSTSSSGTGSTGTGAGDVFLVSTASAATTGPTQEQRRMIRRRENLLHELIQTERTYIQALEQCLDLYRKSLINPPQFLEGKVPAGLVGMTDVVFGNMPDIYQFHKHTFEPELGKYTESGDFLPETERLAELYVEYCVNYTESTRVVIEHGQNYFQALQLRDCCDPASVAELNEGLEAMLGVPKRANDALHMGMLQATKPTELSVSAHQIVQLLHRCDTPHLPPPTDTAGDSNDATVYNPNGTGEWAYIRMLVQGTASSTESPIKEGFIPARLIGAPSGRRRRPQSTSTNHQNSNNSRRSSTAGRKWLPTGSEARRGTGLVSNKRGSKADLNQTQVFSTPYPTATPRVISNEREPPQLMTKPDSVERSPTTATILDNVSEESIDVELPPPMSEIQVIAPKTAEESDVDSPRLGGVDPLRLLDDQSSIASGGLPLKTAETKSSDRPVHSQCDVEPAPDKSSKISHRPASVAEVAGDGRTGMNNVPTLVGLSSGANLSSLGDLRLHGGLSVAAKLVCGSRPSQTGGPSSSSGPDEDMLRGVLDEGAELHFVNRYLFLYDQALVIADAALELLPSSAEDEQSTLCPPRLQCQFRHALPISQISILEDVGVPGSKPTGGQLLWFCLSERARNMITPFDSHLTNPTSSTQSYLCYVVAPRSPDTRVRWLTELTTMVIEARRLSAAFITKIGGLLELPRLGRLSSATLTSSPAASKCKTISTSLAAKSSEQPLSNLLENVHLTATSSS
ncbi:hypothetical protein AHF37_03629 [Paragonimus kellicotti]|nr:hypothetical protein AHF37_03629 [Paragonimus kellicotti]